MTPRLDMNELLMFATFQLAEAQAIADVQPGVVAGQSMVNRLHEAMHAGRQDARQHLIACGARPGQVAYMLRRYDEYLAGLPHHPRDPM